MFAPPRTVSPLRGVNMKNVLITGGAGYLGRAIMRWAAVNDPDLNITIYSRDESKHARCKKMFPAHRYVLGDIRDYDRLEAVMVGHDTVIHGGALKYIPQAEINVSECIAVNVDGSRNVARAAMRTGVERVVGISTDKACLPVNVYGLTKLMMERIFQEADRLSDTQFNLVRYGNVISSTGSVILLFRKQIKESGVITLTDPKMTRFQMTVAEAVNLIMLSLSEDIGGTILIPRMGAMEMGALTEAIIKLESEYAGKDLGVEVKVIGLRLGEKLHEDLLADVDIGKVELVTPDLMRLYPIDKSPKQHIARGYSSHNPDWWIDVDTMIGYIKDCDKVKEPSYD